MKTKCIAFLISAIALSGCAGSSSAASTPAGPTISNGLKDDETFKYLSSYSISKSYNSKEDDKIIVYLPKENTSIYGPNGYGSGHGVTLDISMNTYALSDTIMKEYISKSISEIPDAYGYLETAKVLDMNEDTELNQYFQEAYYLTEDWNQNAEGDYVVYLARQLDDDTQYTLSLEIDQSKCDDSTNDVLAEVASYYEFTTTFDQGVMAAAAQNYNDNPPDYRYETEFGIKFSLPRGYDYDYTNSDYDGTAIFAPDGTASTIDCVNIYLAEIASGYSGSQEKVEAAVKKDFESIEAAEGVTESVSDADIDKGDKPVVRYDSYTDDLHVVGYLFVVDGDLYSCFTASTEEITNDELVYIQTLVTSAASAY